MGNYTEIINAVIMLVVSILGVLVGKNYIDGAKFQQFLQWVQIFVDAAEQLFGAGTGLEKKDYVRSKLAAMGYTLDAQTDAAIEAAVLEVNKKKDEN